MLLIGGMTEAHEWGLDIGLDNYGPVGDMLARCRDFLPILELAEIDADEPAVRPVEQRGRNRPLGGRRSSSERPGTSGPSRPLGNHNRNQFFVSMEYRTTNGPSQW